MLFVTCRGLPVLGLAIPRETARDQKFFQVQVESFTLDHGTYEPAVLTFQRQEKPDHYALIQVGVPGSVTMSV